LEIIQYLSDTINISNWHLILATALFVIFFLWLLQLRRVLKKEQGYSKQLQLESLDQKSKIKYLEQSILDHKAENERVLDMHEHSKGYLEKIAENALHKNRDDLVQNLKGLLGDHEKSFMKTFEHQDKSFHHQVENLLLGLKDIRSQVSDFEKDRIHSFKSLEEQVSAMNKASHLLQEKTTKLESALGRPGFRGKWGEIHLTKVVELAGMQKNCDFSLQSHLVGSWDANEKAARPDMVVLLPGKKTIAVDAKVPLDAYLKAYESNDKTSKNTHMKNHAAALKTHIQLLGQKNYWKSLKNSPEMTILFVPSDRVLDAAVDAMPDLVEYAANKKIILATPSSLILLLKSVAVGWNQQKLNDNAQAIQKLASEFGHRMQSFLSGVKETGAHLGKAVLSYNRVVGSYESRLRPTLQKFHHLNSSSESENIEIDVIDSQTRELTQPSSSEQ